MSTRCNIHFDAHGETYANVYRHSDGYPDGEHGVPAGLEQFFTAVETQTSDTRFADPEYLAAKFVVWQSMQYAPAGNPLDFISVGVTTGDAGDVAWIYTVDCTSGERPSVRWQHAANV
jgi:hypothetical protein